MTYYLTKPLKVGLLFGETDGVQTITTYLEKGRYAFFLDKSLFFVDTI